MTHYSVIWIWGDSAEKHRLATRGFALDVICRVATMVTFARLVMIAYDKPRTGVFASKVVRGIIAYD